MPEPRYVVATWEPPPPETPTPTEFTDEEKVVLRSLAPVLLSEPRTVQEIADLILSSNSPAPQSIKAKVNGETIMAVLAAAIEEGAVKVVE